MRSGQRWLPAIVALAAGGVAISSFVIPNAISDGLLDVAALLTAIGLVVGILNVLNTHRKRIAARAADWPYSIVLIVALLLAFGFGIVANVPGAAAGVSVLAADVFRYVYQPLASSVLALLAFFALRAAWRALQLRPREASIVLGVAIFILLASGPWAVLVPGLAETVQWIRDYPVLGVARGLLLGVAIGSLVASTRVLLGLDQPYTDR